MVSTSLSGPWFGQASSDELRRACIEPGFDDSSWLPLDVPGHWQDHRELEPRRAVLYRTTFHADLDADQRSWLVVDGVWHSGDVWVDGNYLGPTESWFVAHEFEVTDLLADGPDHVLVIEAMAPPPPLEGPRRTLTGIFDDPAIMGHTNRGGIWRAPRLHTTGPVHMAKTRAVCAEADDERAVVSMRCQLESDVARQVTIVTTLRPPHGGSPITTRREHSLAEGATVIEWDLAVEKPELWWPWELGDQPLYRLSVSVEVDGVISDIWDRTIGLRSIEMRNLRLRVNGKQLFGRGVHVWPADALPAQAASQRVIGDVARARDIGLNLLRIDTHLARPELYDAADRLGMLIWQDLPMRGEVKRSVRGAAVDGAHRMVDRLGAHASVAIWCAHHDPTGTTTGPRSTTVLPTRRSLFGVAKQQAPTWTKSVLDRLVGRAFRRADGSRPVIEGSGTWPSAPQFDGTDTHLRFGWNSGMGRDLEAFARRIPRMVRWVSAFGAQSIPDSPHVEIRNWPPDLNLLAEKYGLDERAFREYLPAGSVSDTADWRRASQAYQATLLRRQIETLRRLKYSATGGFCFAALADPRPAVSFAIYDHDRVPKVAVGAVTAACRPVIVVAERLPARVVPGDALLLDVHVVSDQRVPLGDLEVRATLSWPGDDHKWGWAGAVEADSVARIGSINWVVPDVTGPVTLHLELRQGDTVLADNHYRGHIAPPTT